MLSPADGRVTAVEDAVDPFVGPSRRVSIFLSPLDVHVNRAPISGLVTDTVYTPGRFVAAYDPAAGDVNERCAVRIQGETARVTVVQIAGVAARRIVCRVGSGDKLAAGQRFGMIRFGSRTDCYMPAGTDVRVRVVGPERRDGGVYLTLDGQEGFPIVSGLTVVVRWSPESVILLRPPEVDHFDRLASKLSWGV